MCQNIIKLAISENHNGNQIKKIVLSIGSLAAVDIESLKFWFPVASQGTKVEQSELEIIVLEAEAKCEQCLNIFKPTQLYENCPCCHAYEKDILHGLEIMVKQIEI
ncbi:hydrogenase maturation nickel metallochaperone HypA [Thiotrichales bacterium 19S9-12]|nr:hydrogenase maturation nickel metallochaperone HypA [Thiotrichales bacterium 19S9-11]MCF6812018.1 hydrogenase maturation nickel metallochaperone HypA [Thiotrichales bacterium 19S9-12]